MLGAEHEVTLTSAFNRALSPSDCGQNTEACQLFRDTLAAPLRVLGPTHELAQCSNERVHTLDSIRTALSACQEVARRYFSSVSLTRGTMH